MLASVNGINLSYNEVGRAELPTVVLIHGFPFSSAMWEGQVQRLREKNLHIIRYDIRGLGQSDIGDGQYSIELFVDDMMMLLDYLKVTKAIVCGFSMGGYIALRAIERNPDRFNALILCDTMSTADSNEAKIKRTSSMKLVKKEGVARFAEGFLQAVFSAQTFATKPDLVEEVRKIILSNSPLGVCGSLMAMAGRTDTTEALSKIRVPTMILVGEHDTVTPQSAAEIMHQRIPDSKLYIIPNAAHMSTIENPQAFNEHLTRFLDEVNG